MFINSFYLLFEPDFEVKHPIGMQMMLRRIFLAKLRLIGCFFVLQAGSLGDFILFGQLF
jgi:hypothetical protein